MYPSSKNHEELSRTDSEPDRSEFWKIVDKTKPENLRALSDEEIRDCQNYFLEILDSTLPAYESVTASLRLILLRGEIDLRRSDARQRQTQRLLRWAIQVGILSAIVILSAVVAIVFGIANRPTPERVPAAATEAAEIPAIIPPTPAALPTTTPTPAALATTTPAPTASPAMSVVSTRTPTTQKKKTGRTRRRRPTPTPSFWHQFFEPKSTTQAERQIPIVNPTEDEVASNQPEPIATQPQRKAAKDLTVLPTEDVARAEQPQQEVGAKEGFPVSNSPTIAQPSIAPSRGPWLFPDSSSRYLSATDLSSLSSADLWRVRNEIYARKGYKFSSPTGIAFAQTLGNYYRGVDDDQDRVFNNMNQYERANVTLIQSIERGR